MISPSGRSLCVRPQTLALSANAGIEGIDVGVFLVKQMTVQAMRIFSTFFLILQAAGVQCRAAISAFKVFLLGDDFHVVDVHTVTNAAQVVNFVVRWNCSVFQLVRNLVGADCSAVKPETPVSALITTAGPYPTWPEIWSRCWNGAILVYFWPETFGSLDLHRVHCNPTLLQESRELPSVNLLLWGKTS